MTKAKLFCLMVMYLSTTALICHAGRSKLLSSQPDVSKHLNRLNKHPLKSIKSPDGDIIDCFHIYNQPAFDHPLLKNHTIKMKPNYYPNWINTSKVGNEDYVQLWQLNDKCPKDNVPIRRRNKDNLHKTDFSKKSFLTTRRNSFNSELNDASYGHEYAIAATQGQVYGAKATFNIWNPMTQTDDEFSLGQLWITAGPDSVINTIEAGWQVFPEKYQDTNTRFFTYWTNDGYHDGCYNLECSGFIQTNNDIVIGGSIFPTSQIDGSQYDLTIFIWKDPSEGDWWMQLGDKVVGYWPASLFPYLSESSSMVQWGGEVKPSFVNGPHTTTQMGSGHFPEDGYRKASYINNIQIVDETTALRDPESLQPYVSNKYCYDISMHANDIENWGTYIFYGGPGRNEQCQ